MPQAIEDATTTPPELKVNPTLANKLLAMTADELARWPSEPSGMVNTALVHVSRSDHDKRILTLCEAIMELRRLCAYLWEASCGEEASRLYNVVEALQRNLAEREPESNSAANAMLLVAFDICAEFERDPDSLSGRGPAAQIIRQVRTFI